MGFLSSIGGLVGGLIGGSFGSPGIGSAIGSGLGGFGDTLIGGSNAASASSTQAAGDTAAVNLQRQMYTQQRADKLPYLGGGTAANNQLAYLMGITPNDPNAGANETAAQKSAFNPTAGVNTSLGASGSLSSPFDMSKFTADPGYQFSLDQGTQALQRSAAARGGLMSGAAMKDLSTYAQGTAAQEYGSVYDRYRQNQNDLYSRLSGLSNSGQSMANSSGEAGTKSASASITPMENAAQLNATGQNQQSQAWTSGLGQLGSAVASAFNQPSSNNIIWN